MPLLRVILLPSYSSMASYNGHIRLNVGMFDHLHNIEQINGAGWPRSWWQDTGANLSFSNVFFFFVFPSNNLSFRTFSLLFQKTLSTRRMYECVTIQYIHTQHEILGRCNITYTMYIIRFVFPCRLPCPVPLKMERSFGEDAGIYDLEYTWNPSTDLSDIFIYMESVDRFVRNIDIHGICQPICPKYLSELTHTVPRGGELSSEMLWSKK